MNINSFFIKSLKPSSHSFNYQIVRWRKPSKPFWIGPAKSKMFVIPEPRVIRPPEEKEEFKRLTGEYDTHFSSLLNFINVENPRIDIFSGRIDGDEIKMSPELEKMMSDSYKRNEKWNAESAVLRERRMKESLEKEMETAIKEINEHEEKRMKRIEWIEEIVKKEKELSKTYITPENLDEVIEKCLDNVVCYDFAIDLQGNKYEGRNSLPSQFQEEQNVAARDSKEFFCFVKKLNVEGQSQQLDFDNDTLHQDYQ